MTSQGIRTAQGQLEPRLAAYLDNLQEIGITGLYVVGIYKTSVFSELIMPHFARSWHKQPEDPAHIGASVFAVDDLVPTRSIEGWENLRFLRDEAERRGIALIVDFIPNTIGLDSRLVRQHADLISDAAADHGELERFQSFEAAALSDSMEVYSRSKITHEPGEVQHRVRVLAIDAENELVIHERADCDGSSHKFYLQRNLRRGFAPHFWMLQYDPAQTVVHCKELGRDTNSGVVWADVARLKTWSTEVQSLQARLLHHLNEIVPIVRADMSHLPGPEYWGSLLRTARDLRLGLPEIWGEAYGPGKHSELAHVGMKSYANWIREWLRQGDIPKLMHQVHDLQYGQQFLKANAIVYSANHDDGRGEYNLIEGAISAILVALPAPVVMFSQGQRFGDSNRYGADQHVPWHDFDARSIAAGCRDPEYVNFMNRLVSLSALRVFRDPASQCRPGCIEVRGSKNWSKIFHAIRELGEERVLTVVDFQAETPGAEIRVDIAASFSVAVDELRRFKLVNLIDGRTHPAERFLTLNPLGQDVGFNTYFYALMPSDPEV